MSRSLYLTYNRKPKARRRAKALRRNAKKSPMLLIGAAAVGGVALWWLLRDDKKSSGPGYLPPGTGEVVYVPAPAGSSTAKVPASTQVVKPADAGMPDWMKAAVAAGALIPGALPGTLVINAAYDWFKSDTPWWQKAAMAAGFLIPGAGAGTLLMNAAYDWWKSW